MSVQGCPFHFVQALVRNFSPEMKKLYIENCDFSLFCKKFFGLPFIHPKDVRQAFKLICNCRPSHLLVSFYNQLVWLCSCSSWNNFIDTSFQSDLGDHHYHYHHESEKNPNQSDPKAQSDTYNSRIHFSKPLEHAGKQVGVLRRLLKSS